MINIILFGPPGSGKGTQKDSIASRYQLHAVSTGDILRSEIAQETELGLLAKSYMDKGCLVPDDVVVRIIEGVLVSHPEAKGFLFDGYPRTAAQAVALDKMLNEHNAAVTALLELDVPDDELRVRLLRRKEIEGRSDDNIDTINNRLEVYHNQTSPVIDHYKTLSKHHRIDGVGSIDEIYNRLLTVLEPLV